MDDLRQSISEILVKWHMPTRQVAINEIMALIDSYSREARINELEQAWDWAVLNNQTSIKGSWILKRIRKLKALGAKPEGKPNE